VETGEKILAAERKLLHTLGFEVRLRRRCGCGCGCESVSWCCSAAVRVSTRVLHMRIDAAASARALCVPSADAPCALSCVPSCSST
jgi:hypothetical protein